MLRFRVLFVFSTGLALALGVACASAGDGLSKDSSLGGATGASTAVAGQQSSADSQIDRKLVTTSSLSIEVGDLRGAYGQVGQLTKSLGGYVADSSISEDSAQSTATIRLRVPAARHDEILAALRALGGKVLKESTRVEEVTEEYTDLESRLLNLQRNEAQYQELIKQARSVEEILNVSARLDSVRGEIERARGRINLLDSLTDFATINVTISTPVLSADTDLPGPLKVFSEAWEASLAVGLLLVDFGAVLAVLAIWALPIALVGYVLWRIFRERITALLRGLH